MNQISNLALLGVLLLSSLPLSAASLRIFDTHLHYNTDALEQFGPEEVLKLLDDAGISQVLVSSTDDTGTQKLLNAAPGRVLPALRPYRKPGTIKTWMHDQTVIPYLETKLAQHKYIAFGEFHAFEEHIDLPVVTGAVELAKAHNLLLHVHGDKGAVEKLFALWPEARVLWAHAGFDDPENVTALLSRHANLWIDLSHRSDISTWAGLAANWEQAFMTHPERYLVGSDTYSLERWKKLGFFALNTRDWLSVLPEEIARKIAYENAQTLFNNHPTD